MSDRGETRAQPSIPEARLGPEQAWLGLAIAVFTIAVVALIVEHQTGIQLLRGGYSVLTGVFVAGCLLWRIEAAERRTRREQRDGVCNCPELSKELKVLREEVARSRVTYLPPPPRQPGRRYLPTAVGGEGDPVPPGPPGTGLDPETIAAARALARRIAGGPAGGDQQS